ncbi:MAG: OOP family OmpA-OmpF porin [Cocleimonas sp.]|jgi:OOP family OmpA-OmpF porin
MKFTHSTFRKSLIVMGLISSFATFSFVHAELPKAFDYTKASTNYVDNTTSGRSDLFSNGYYVGGAIGQSEASTYCNGASGCEDSDSAWKVFGGYKLLDKLSIEGAYLNLGDIRKDGQNSDVSAFAAYGVGTLPVTEKFDAFAKLGATHWKSENTDGNQSGFGMAYGIGAKMTLNETTKIRAEWEKILDVETSNSEKSDINMLSIGVEISTF